jgi:hypothetical protein
MLGMDSLHGEESPALNQKLKDNLMILGAESIGQDLPQ